MNLIFFNHIYSSIIYLFVLALTAATLTIREVKQTKQESSDTMT